MTRRLCLVLVLALLLASFAPAAERAPLPGPPTDWRAVGDTLLYAGASWDSLDA
ncbi:MAG: lipase, partial [Candidatus Riflebacteria bacterium]|nr:lipase [Candidatus Riflebacteria bacterium]